MDFPVNINKFHPNQIAHMVKVNIMYQGIWYKGEVSLELSLHQSWSSILKMSAISKCTGNEHQMWRAKWQSRRTWIGVSISLQRGHTWSLKAACGKMTNLVGMRWCAHFQIKILILGGIFNFQIQDHVTGLIHKKGIIGSIGIPNTQSTIGLRFGERVPFNEVYMPLCWCITP